MLTLILILRGCMNEAFMNTTFEPTIVLTVALCMHLATITVAHRWKIVLGTHEWQFNVAVMRWS